MDFIDELKQFSKRVENIKGSITTEEATKTSIIMPFFAMLLYMQDTQATGKVSKA